FSVSSYRVSVFDHNRQVPDRYILFPIFRNISFVFRNRQVPTDIFRSQYPVISVLFSRPHFSFPLPFPFPPTVSPPSPVFSPVPSPSLQLLPSLGRPYPP